ncbi:hypothetical protein M426DRAFT_324253 [Hypoxylon sp. CI-4A]|nr:hypothetical protein M426DRAFT_324253 [Hypoxylon sp. CI-4A]
MTNFTVRSPFQDPMPRQECEHPHIDEPIPQEQACSWHPGCCRLEKTNVCFLEEQGLSCSTWIKYHHFVDVEAGEVKDLSFLGAYRGTSPALLNFIPWFFRAGVFLRIAEVTYQKKYEHLQQTLGPEKSLRFEPDIIRCTSMIALAADILTQFARFWDFNTGFGIPIPRPGGHESPAVDANISAQLGLKVVGWDRENVGTWPGYSQEFGSPEVRAQLHNDPSTVFFGTNMVVEMASLLSQQSPFHVSLPQTPRAPRLVFHMTPPPSSFAIPAPFMSPAYSPPTSSPPRDVFSLGAPPASMVHALPAPSSSAPPSHSPPTPSPAETEPSPEDSTSTESPHSDEDSTEDEGGMVPGGVYMIDNILGHRPSTSTRRKDVHSFKVRWEGGGVSWQNENDMNPDLIAEYWATVIAKNRKKSTALRRRRARQLKGQY